MTLYDHLPAYYRVEDRAYSVAEAEAYTAALARRHYENFTVVSWFLPRRLRQPKNLFPAQLQRPVSIPRSIHRTISLRIAPAG